MIAQAYPGYTIEAVLSAPAWVKRAMTLHGIAQRVERRESVPGAKPKTGGFTVLGEVENG